METNEKNDGIDPDKVIADSRTIRRPQAAVGNVQDKPSGEPNVDDIQPPEREFVTEQQPEPSQEQASPAVAVAPKQPKSAISATTLTLEPSEQELQQQLEREPEPVSVPTISVAATLKPQSVPASSAVASITKQPKPTTAPALEQLSEPVSAPMIPITTIPKQQQPEPATPSITSAPAPKRQEQRESSGRRRGLPSYRDVFVSRNEIKHRQCVYISHEVHSLVSSLVRALVEEGGEITVGGYIDKVLYEHLQKEEINELYRNRRPELLK